MVTVRVRFSVQVVWFLRGMPLMLRLHITSHHDDSSLLLLDLHQLLPTCFSYSRSWVPHRHCILTSGDWGGHSQRQKLMAVWQWQPRVAQIRVHNKQQNPTIQNPNPNPTTKQHATVNIQLNIVTCPTYPDKFIRDNVVTPSVLL